MGNAVQGFWNTRRRGGILPNEGHGVATDVVDVVRGGGLEDSVGESRGQGTAEPSGEDGVSADNGIAVGGDDSCKEARCR
jgi:hypothetical protein